MFVQINKETFEQLKSISIDPVPMGSHLHGTVTDQSDYDLFYLYNDKNYVNSPYDFGFQYKDIENDTDHNFCDYRVFLKMMLKGESPTYFEIAMHMDLKSVDQAYTNNISYNLIKGYTGYMKKDLKRYKAINQKCYAKNKYASHIVRQYDMLMYLLKASDYPHTNESRCDYYLRIKNGFYNFEDDYLDNLVENALTNRHTVHHRYENGDKNVYQTVSQNDYESIKEELRSVVGDGGFIDTVDYKYLIWKSQESGLTFQYI